MPSPDEVAAGVAAGVCDALASHPIDQVKTQFHVNRHVNPSILTTLHEQLAAGGVPRLYRGVSAACLRPQSLCFYAGNESSRRVVAGSLSGRSDGSLSVLESFVAGGLTGYMESACVTPFEVVKVRMQSLDHVGKYTSSVQCLRLMLAEEGPLALTTGFWASCWRNCTFNGVMMGCVHGLKESEAVPLPQPAAGSAAAVALDVGVGMLASAVAQRVDQSAPPDGSLRRLGCEPRAVRPFRRLSGAPFPAAGRHVLQGTLRRRQVAPAESAAALGARRVSPLPGACVPRTRTPAAEPSAHLPSLWYPRAAQHTLQTCAAIVREEGADALYKGFTPTLLRMVVGQGVAYASFELALKQLRRRPGRS